MKPLRSGLFSAFILFLFSGSAQLSGSYNIPGNITSIAAAISSLNAVGVNGPVTINIAAGYTEITPVGGFQLNTVAGASTVNTIIFQKSGAGANPLVTAYTGGVGTPSAGVQQDGIWKFSGSDFITVDGIDIMDPNTSNPATMEFGFGFFKVGGANGCQNNTIKNCVITLNRVNADVGGANSPTGSKGIYLASTSASSYTQSINVTSAAGTNSGNKFYTNKIQNCHAGICFNGCNTLGYEPYSDQLNDIGGLLAATGNTIVNFGGGAGSFAIFGINAAYQYSLNASYNVIRNNDGAGVEPASPLWGIYALTHLAAAASFNSNTITLSCTVTNSLSLGGITSVANNTTGIGAPPVITINNNIFPGYNNINNSASMASVLIFSSNFPSITSISNNLFQNINAGSDLYNIITCPQASTCTINSNTVTNVSFLGSNYHELIDCDAPKALFTNNLINNVTDNSSSNGGIYCFTGGYGSNELAATGNTITNITANTCWGFSFYSNITVAFSVTGNVLTNWSSVPGATVNASLMGIYFSNYSGFSTGTVSANAIYSMSCMSPVSNATISTGIIGINMDYINSVTISQNKIYDFTSDRYGASLLGIHTSALSGSYNSGIYNNLIGGFEATNTNNTISGIYPQTQVNTIAYNTVYLNGPNTGSNTNSQALDVYALSSSSFGGTTLKNNIFINAIPATGTGTACAIRMQTITPYNNTSDRNLLYAGIPAGNRLIAKIGPASYSVITAFKAAVSPRELQTFTESTVFTTTLGTQPDLLKPDLTVATLAEGGASPIAGITTDYAGNIRNATNPDIGAREDNFLGFDRLAPLIISSGFASLPCNNFTNRTYTISLADVSGVATGALAPRLYYKVNSGSYTSVQGILSSGTATNGVWTFNLSYSGSAGNLIFYFLVAQDQSSFSNVLAMPSVGAIVANVNSVIVPPTPDAYELQDFPVIGVNSGTICSGQDFELFPYGASTYTFSGGTSTVSPLITTAYSVTGTSSEGCAATNTAVANITVYTTPSISVNSGTICSGQVFQISPSGASTYVYQGGSATVSPMVSTVYSVTGTSAEGCLSAAAAASVTVHATPVLFVNSGGICYGQSFTISPSGAVSYTFSGGSAIVSPQANATYSVTGTSANGCVSAGVVSTVFVYQLPVLNLTASSQSICSGQSISLQVTGATAFTWQPGDTHGAQLTVSPTITTTYSVSGRDGHGCSSTSVTAITVNNCVGIEKVNAGNAVNMYPNPCQGQLNIILNTAAYPLTVKIYNAVSQLVYNVELKAPVNMIDLGNLPKGMYVVSMQQGDRLLKQQKLVLD